MGVGGVSETLTIADVHAFLEAAVADGWIATESYPGHEPLKQAFTLNKDGWIVHGLARPKGWAHYTRDCADLVAWGPDRLQIVMPKTYSAEAMQAGLRTCQNCGATDVETQRYSFAGRCCAACRPEMARLTEYPGWTK